MPKPISLKNLIKRFKDKGFEGPYAGGKHQFMILDKLKLRIPNPHGGDISAGLLSNILRQAGIKSRDW